jgi:hypothetical protein
VFAVDQRGGLLNLHNYLLAMYEMLVLRHPQLEMLLLVLHDLLLPLLLLVQCLRLAQPLLRVVVLLAVPLVANSGTQIGCIRSTPLLAAARAVAAAAAGNDTTVIAVAAEAMDHISNRHQTATATTPVVAPARATRSVRKLSKTGTSHSPAHQRTKAPY